MAAAPPSRVPVQPIRGHDVAVEDEVVDQRQRVQLRFHIIVVRSLRHVLRGAESDQIVPVVSRAVLFPRPTPRLQKVHEVPRLVVVFSGEIHIIHFFPVLINSPILTIEVHDATLIGSLIKPQICQMA